MALLLRYNESISALINLTGQKFGRLTVVKRSGSDRWKQALWLCQCDCGNTTVVRGHDMKRRNTTSCGCIYRESAREKGHANTTHGQTRALTRSPTYISWASMKQRCFDPNSTRYHRYGGRGITVFEGWVSSFENFLADMGERPSGKSLDRINNDGNYEPGNCRWATPLEQRLNQSS